MNNNLLKLDEYDGLVVVGFPFSDIGKGWLTAALGQKLGHRKLIKIDPVLETDIPIVIEEARKDNRMIHDDAVSYITLGNDFDLSQEILMGQFLQKGLLKKQNNLGIVSNDIPKRTYADIAYDLALRVKDITNNGIHKFIVEVGGCPDDLETALIPYAMRHLRTLCKIKVGIIILTKVDFVYANKVIKLKTRNVLRAVDTVMKYYYDLPLAMCYYRVVAPKKLMVSNREIVEVAQKVAFKAGVDQSLVKWFPEVETLEGLTKSL